MLHANPALATAPLPTPGVWALDDAERRPAPTPPDRAIARLAARRFGVVTREELVAAGLAPRAIDRRLQAGFLLRLHRGVYAVGHRSLRVEGAWWAAVLAGGTGAVLSHRSAALLYGLPRFEHERIEITSAGDRGRRLPSLHAHRGRLVAADVTRRRGIPVTTPSRLWIDLAEVLTAGQLDRVLDEAVRLRLYDPRAVDATIARANGRRGIGPLQRARRRIHPQAGSTRSELERRASRLLDAHGIPRPVRNWHRFGYRLDLQWPVQRAVVELDGYDFHRTPRAFADDHARDNDLLDVGWRVRRFTWDDVTRDGARTAARIRALLEGAR